MQKNIQISLHTLTDFCSFFLSEILSFSIIFDRKIDKRGGKKYTIDTNKQRMHKFPTMQQKHRQERSSMTHITIRDEFRQNIPVTRQTRLSIIRQYSAV